MELPNSDDLFDSILMADDRADQYGRKIKAIYQYLTPYVDHSNPDIFIKSVVSFHIDGYREGYEEGTRQGLREGRNHGVLHGAKLSAEVSFYHGFALTWKCLLQNSNEVKTRKRLKAVESLLTLTQKFPYEDPQYENLQEDLERVRAKFRQVCSLLSVAADFREYVSGSAGLSF